MSNICSVNIKRELKKSGLEFHTPIDAELLGYILPMRVQAGNDKIEAINFFPKMNKGKNGWGIWYETNSTGLQVDADGEVREVRYVLLNTIRREEKLADAIGSYIILMLENGVTTPEFLQERINQFSR